MPKSCAIILLWGCLLAPGCSFVTNIRRNIPHELHYAYDEKAIDKHAHRLARQAWRAMADQYGDCFSEAYRDGFIDGFVDYIVYGGCPGECGESPIIPAVPPERYTHARYMTPAGYRAIEDWFMGFRHGSSTALASGLRNLVVVPVFDPPVLDPENRLQSMSTNVPPEAAGGMLPAPRPVTDTGGASVVPYSSSGATVGPVPAGPAGQPRPVPGTLNPGGPPGIPQPGPPPGGRPAAPPPGTVPGGLPTRPPG